MTKELRSIRALGRDSLRGVEPAKVGKKLPRFELVNPAKLYVEDTYQRSILENGTALIRRIYAGFNWARYKPPICVRLLDSGNVLVCIDGQHTATACATLGIEKIPVMIVAAGDVAERAAAFVGHNKDRISLTTVMIYAAELAAGDPLAVTIDKACRAAGAGIPRRMVVSKGSKIAVGTTISIGALRAIAKHQGGEALTRVLRVLVAAKRAPIKSVEIAAVAMIFGAHGLSVDKRLQRVIEAKTAEEWAALGYINSATTGLPLAASVAQAWCRELEIEAPTCDLKGNPSDHSRLIRTPKPQAPHRAEAPPPPPQPSAPPESQPPLQVEPTPSLPPEKIIEWNGVGVDLIARTVRHRGHVSEPLPDDALHLVAALARVMPAMLIYNDLAKKAFGRVGVSPEYDVGNLVKEIAPRLKAVRLCVNTVPKMGNVLTDLGATA